MKNKRIRIHIVMGILALATIGEIFWGTNPEPYIAAYFVCIALFDK